MAIHDDRVCPKHGDDRHVFVHEAGHAVAAVDNGIEFRAIRLYDAASMPKFDGGLVHAPGAVEMLDDDPQVWVQPDLVAALRFLLGGVVAEGEVLGDSIKGGWAQDIKTWRFGAGRTDEVTSDELTEMLGRPMMDIYNEQVVWAEGNATRIEALADFIEKNTAPWEMSRADVIEFLNALAA